MNVKTAFICGAIFCLVFGILCGGLGPRWLSSLLDIELNDAGFFIVNIFGAALLGFSAILWYARNEPPSGARYSIIIGETIHSGIAAIFWINALFQGLGNLLILVPLLGHLGLAVWFGYFWINERKQFKNL